MRQVVNEAFFEFNRPLEGVVAWMYLDVKGLVTVGVGNLLPTEGDAAALPFYPDGNPDSLADDATKRQGWRDVHARQELAPRGHLAFKRVCDLRLSDDAIAEVVAAKLAANERVLLGIFPQFADWPADAQLGLLSMAWALGPAFPATWPKFKSACLAADFTAAADECRIRGVGNPGVIPRNTANQLLFRNAGKVTVTANGYDPDVLYYPSQLTDVVVIGPEE